MNREIYDRIAACVLVVLVFGLVIWALCSPALACPENEPGIYTDCTVWAVDAETRELCGTFSPDEQVAVLPIQNAGNRVRGFLEGGYVIRVAARVRVLCAGDVLLGLTKCNNTRIEIDGEYLPIVSEIVWRTLGDKTEICGGSISGCMIDFRDGTATERLYTKYTGYVVVGRVYFNTDIAENDWLLIAVGDWNGDGLLDLGLVAGSAPEPVKEPEKPADESGRKETKGNESGESGNCSINSNSSETVKLQDCWTFEITWSFDLLLKHCKKVFGL